MISRLTRFSALLPCSVFIGWAMVQPFAVAQPPDISFSLLTATHKAMEMAKAGDTAGYQKAMQQIRQYIRSVYRPNDLDNGWKELAEAQIINGDRDGARLTARSIRQPLLRAREFVNLAHKYKEGTAFSEAVQAGLQCPEPDSGGATLRDVARDQFRARLKRDAFLTLRKATERWRTPLTGRDPEEHRQEALRRICIDQSDYGDFDGATLTARAIPDPERIARNAVARLRAGDKKGCQSDFNEAIRLASQGKSNAQSGYLEQITYALLECGIVSTARDVAVSIPTGPLIASDHRERAISSVVYALADSGNIAGAKKLASSHHMRYYFVDSLFRIAADQRLAGKNNDAVQTLALARQAILSWPGEKGGLGEDKVNCLNRIALVQHLFNAQQEWRKTIAESMRLGKIGHDNQPDLDNLKDTIFMQSMCGDVPQAVAAARQLPMPYRQQTAERIRGAAEEKQGLVAGLQNECLDPKKARHP